jgi:pyruvate dehydrogenase E2 component (dihydrolipoamide acetyltransferase)
VPEAARTRAAAVPGARAAAGPFVQASPGKVLAAPATRRRARELGIDLAAIAATGPRGRVTNDDLAAAAPARGAPSSRRAAGRRRRAARQVRADRDPAGAPRAAAKSACPFRGLRRKIAEAMTRSKYTADALHLRRRHRRHRAGEDPRRGEEGVRRQGRQHHLPAVHHEGDRGGDASSSRR